MALSPGRSALRSFYVQLKGTNPTMAVLVAEDVIHIALFENEEDKAAVQNNVDHLREMTNTLPVDIRMLREDALEHLGYS